MKVICKNVGDFPLTVGKIYDVVSTRENQTSLFDNRYMEILINDDLSKAWYSGWREYFTSLEEHRDKQLNRLGI